MHLLNLPLLGGQSVQHAIVGQFSGEKAQELLVCKGNDELELFRLDSKRGKLITLARTNVFGVIRSIVSFRVIGVTKGLRTIKRNIHLKLFV